MALGLALSQVRVDSLLGASCPGSGCKVRVDQGESPGCELTCYQTGVVRLYNHNIFICTPFLM